jgi:hypothetical protein
VDLIGSGSCPVAGVGVSGIYYEGVDKMHGDNRKPLCNASFNDSNVSPLAT